jgi:carboxymethylenebutenolidase
MHTVISLPVTNAPDMNCYVSVPNGNGPFPAVMVFQEAFGVNGHIRNVADRLAEEGYIAISPELFHRTAPPGFEAGYNDFSLLAPHFPPLTPEALIVDVTATYNWLQQQENVQKNEIGCIGFCLGGKVSFLANSALQLSASVSFYGGSMHTVVDRTATLSCPQLLFWGGKDQHIKPEHIQTVLSALRKEQKDFINVEISYADHGFFCYERAAYNPQAAKEAWGMTKEFLKNRLT